MYTYCEKNMGLCRKLVQSRIPDANLFEAITVMELLDEEEAMRSYLQRCERDRSHFWYPDSTVQRANESVVFVKYLGGNLPFIRFNGRY